MKKILFGGSIILATFYCFLTYAKASGTTHSEYFTHTFAASNFNTPAHEIATISLSDYNAYVWGTDFTVTALNIPNKKSLTVTYYNEYGNACMRNQNNSGVTNSGASVSSANNSVTTQIYHTQLYTESITVKMKKGTFDTWGATLEITITFDMA